MKNPQKTKTFLRFQTFKDVWPEEQKKDKGSHRAVPKKTQVLSAEECIKLMASHDCVCLSGTPEQGRHITFSPKENPWFDHYVQQFSRWGVPLEEEGEKITTTVFIHVNGLMLKAA